MLQCLQVRVETSVTLAKDARETTPCALTVQTVGPVMLDIARAAHITSHDDCLHTPIQLMDIVFRQRLTLNMLDE